MFSVVPRDLEDVSFYGIPKVSHNKSSNVPELSKKRRAGFLGAICRGNLTEKVLANDRICSRYYVSGKPASLEDETNPDWLPSLLLGHSNRLNEQVQATGERWARRNAKDEARATGEAAQALLSLTCPADASDPDHPMNKDVGTQTDILHTK